MRILARRRNDALSRGIDYEKTRRVLVEINDTRAEDDDRDDVTAMT